MHTIEELSIEELQGVSKVLSAPVVNTREGICGNYLARLPRPCMRVVLWLMYQCCKELGVLSGNSAYPIKHKWVNEEAAYFRENLWELKSDYCLNRIRVLELMREKVDAALKESMR